MSVIDWPAAAKIQRLDLRLSRRMQVATSPLSGLQMRGASRSELWVGEAVIAPRARADLDAISAFVESLRGRNQPFLLPLTEDFCTFTGPSDGALSTAAVAGNTSLAVTFTTGSLTLKAGTLILLGEQTDEKQQILEVASDTTTGTAVSVPLTSRIRYGAALSTAVYTSGIYLRARLADDASGEASYSIGWGSLTIPFVEVPRYS